MLSCGDIVVAFLHWRSTDHDTQLLAFSGQIHDNIVDKYFIATDKNLSRAHNRARRRQTKQRKFLPIRSIRGVSAVINSIAVFK